MAADSKVCPTSLCEDGLPVGEDQVAQLAVLRDGPTVARLQRSVAAEAACTVLVSEVPFVRPESDLHLGKDVLGVGRDHAVRGRVQ